MPAQSGLGFSGIAAIQIPDDGATGEVLTKLTPDDYDYDWSPVAGGFAPANAEYVVLALDATLTDERVLTPGVGLALVDGGAGGLVTLNVDLTLQEAYDNLTTVPQITINATPDPLTIDASVVGDVFAVRDVINQDLLRLSTTGGSIVGGSNAGNILTLEGALAATADTGIVRSNSPITISYNTIDNTTPAESFAVRWNPTATISALYVGGFLTVAPVFTVTTGVYVPATFSDTSSISIAAVPGFSAFTFINELATVRNSGNFNLPSGIITNIGFTHERNTSGTSTTPGITGVSFVPQTRATVSGAVMTRTAQAGINVNPTFSTVAGSTVNLGNITGIDCFQPSLALFQPGAGTESATSYIGLRMRANVFPTGVREAVRSELAVAAINFCIRNLGGAQSNWGGGNHFNCGFVQILSDTATLSLGAAGGDLQIGWNGAALEFDPLVGDDMRFTFATDIHTIVSASVSEDSAINFDYPKGAFGEAGAPGNNKYRFVANAETITIGGDFSQFLLTQAANDTIDAALGTYAGWTINAPTPVIGSGSLTNSTALLIGGNPGAAATDRTGLRIISNPTGGAGVNAALYVTAGLSRFDGRVDINNADALGGGAAATLGTIGGTGPTAAAQAQWMDIDIGGVQHWVPVWT